MTRIPKPLSQMDDQRRFKIEVVVKKDSNGYHAYCPAFKGLHVGGNNPKEVLQNVKDALELYLISMIKNDEPIPIGIDEKRIRMPIISTHRNRTKEYVVATISASAMVTGEFADEVINEAQTEPSEEALAYNKECSELVNRLLRG